MIDLQRAILPTVTHLPNWILAIAALVVLTLRGQALGQDDKGTPIVFHVTAVRSEDAKDWCTTGECSATRYTVEGYSDVKGDSGFVEYVLDCVETLVEKPSPHYTAVCGRVHAHNDYQAKLWSDSIFFGDETKPPSSNGVFLVAYHIVSEREASKQKK